MGETIALAGLISGVAALLYGWQRTRLRQSVRGRLGHFAGPAELAEPAPAVDVVPFVRRNLWLPWLAAAAVAAGLHYGAGLQSTFAIMFGVIVGLLGSLLDKMRVARVSALIERQLADAIDLMVGALRAGSAVPAAIESAVQETRAPLKGELQEILGRLRFGDNPQEVFHSLMRRVPLETFRLLAATLATHWEVGGSLAPTLATVGRTIRDRIEVSRRIRSLTTQSRVSIIAVLCATYFIALVMWRNDPQRMSDFLATSIGRYLVTGAVVLQAIGIVWTSGIGRVKY